MKSGLNSHKHADNKPQEEAYSSDEDMSDLFADFSELGLLENENPRCHGYEVEPPHEELSLHEAIQLEKLNLIKEILLNEKNENSDYRNIFFQKDSNKNTPLMKAILLDNTDILKVLLDFNCPVLGEHGFQTSKELFIFLIKHQAKQSIQYFSTLDFFGDELTSQLGELEKHCSTVEHFDTFNFLLSVRSSLDLMKFLDKAKQPTLMLTGLAFQKVCQSNPNISQDIQQTFNIAPGLFNQFVSNIQTQSKIQQANKVAELIDNEFTSDENKYGVKIRQTWI